MDDNVSYNDDWARDFERRAAEQRAEAAKELAVRQQEQQQVHVVSDLAAARTAEYRKRTLRRLKRQVIAEASCLPAGLFFLLAGAEENNNLNDQTPGAPLLWVAGVLIGGAVIAFAISLVTFVHCDNNAERLAKEKGNPMPWIATALGCLASLAIGVIIIATQSWQSGAAGKDATTLGIVFIVLGLLGEITWLTAGIRLVFAPQRAQYKRWLNSLTPQQRAAYYGAQAAGMMLAHQALRHSNERARERRAAAQARRDYIKRSVRAMQEGRPFDEPPPPGMSSSWGR
jgi:hypothetical protein